jgi:hypothetical protein
MKVIQNINHDVNLEELSVINFPINTILFASEREMDPFLDSFINDILSPSFERLKIWDYLRNEKFSFVSQPFQYI